MELFETQSTITEDTFQELKRHLMPAKQKKIMFAAVALSIVLLLYGIVLSKYSLILAMLAALVILISEYIMIVNKCVKVNVDRMQEMVHAKECEYTTSFTDTGFLIKNHGTNGVITIAYEDIIKVVETKTCYALCTKANQFGIVNKTVLNDEDRHDLIQFLATKCKDIHFYLLKNS